MLEGAVPNESTTSIRNTSKLLSVLTGSRGTVIGTLVNSGSMGLSRREIELGIMKSSGAVVEKKEDVHSIVCVHNSSFRMCAYISSCVYIGSVCSPRNSNSLTTNFLLFRINRHFPTIIQYMYFVLPNSKTLLFHSLPSATNYVDYTVYTLFTPLYACAI